MSISNKDNALRGARNLGDLSGSKRINGFVGQKDKLDLAKFSLSEVSEFGLTIGRVLGRSSSVRVTLRDSSGFVFQNIKSGPKAKTLGGKLAPGTYFIGIQRLKGDINYKLTASATTAEPGEALSTARDIGVLTGTYLNQDFVGTTDSSDLYKFTLGDVSNLQARVNGSSANTQIQLISDLNGNGLIDNDEILATDTNFSSSFLSTITQDVPSGPLYLKIDPSSSTASTQYSLSLVATAFGGNIVPDAGNTLPTARDLGALAGTVIPKDYVGKADSTDIYKFTLNDISNLQVNVRGLSTNTQIDLIRDINGNGLIDNNEVIASDTNFSSNFLSSITQDLPSGNYFIKVAPRSSSQSTLYELTVVATPFGGTLSPDPGNTIPTARDLGVLNGTFTAKENVGIVDPIDFYKFTLNSAKTLQARVTATSANTQIDLIRDTNGNGLIDNNEIIESDTNLSSNYLSNFTEDLAAGTYFFRVIPRSSSTSTNYSLELTV